MLKSTASLFIWYRNVPSYLFWVSGRDKEQIARRNVWEEM